MGTWPGETKITEQWDWDHGEAPTLEFTREYPVAAPTGSLPYSVRVKVERTGKHSWRWFVEHNNRGEWTMALWPATRWSGCGFSMTEERAIAKGHEKALKWIGKMSKRNQGHSTAFSLA